MPSDEIANPNPRPLISAPKIEFKDAHIELEGPLIVINEWPSLPHLTWQTSAFIFLLGITIIILGMLGILGLGWSWYFVQTLKQ